MRNKLKFGDFIIIGVVLVMAGALAAALAFHSSGDVQLLLRDKQPGQHPYPM